VNYIDFKGTVEIYRACKVNDLPSCSEPKLATTKCLIRDNCNVLHTVYITN